MLPLGINEILDLLHSENDHCSVDAGSADKTVRLWSLDAGMPLATSRSHSGTVRALALDEHLLVSASNLARPRPAPHMLGTHAKGGCCWDFAGVTHAGEQARCLRVSRRCSPTRLCTARSLAGYATCV